MTEDCWACSESNGPADGLYLPEEMPLCSPPGGAIGLWSSSPVDDMLSQKWVIQFQFAYIIYRHINDKGMDVRCVR
jgi:hypothetical protein